VHHGFFYSGINTSIIKAFLASQKIKVNGEMAYFSHIRKFKGAILFGAEQAGQILPRLSHQETDTFLKAFKNEQVGVRREGILTRKSLILSSFLFIIKLPK
jgi:hypothetical protein